MNRPREPTDGNWPGGVRLGAGHEFDIIRRYLAAEPSHPPSGLLVGPGDDCAVVTGAGIVVGSDLSVEDVHFRRAWLGPEEIGYRAAAAALSDLAAMAARPIGVLVSLMLSSADASGPAYPNREPFGDRVVAGVRAAARAVGADLIGGDVARSTGPLALDVVVIGEAAAPVLRSGGRSGDELWVTGPLGGAAAAVAAWTGGREPAPAARTAFARPTPRVIEAAWLAGRGLARAMIDISDGLAGDAGHIAAASGLAAVLDAGSIPVHPAVVEVAAGSEARLRMALGGGEDYELLVAAPPGELDAVVAELEAETGARPYRVGTLESGAGVSLRRADGALEPLARGGYDHFGGGDR